MFTSRTPFVSVVSESGLYRFILQGRRSPTTAAFQDWVTRDVLPAIRKDGAYVMGEEKVKRGEMTEDELVLQAVSILQAKVSRLSEEKKALAAVNATLEPKAILVDQHFARLDWVPISRFARTLDGVNSNMTKRDALFHGNIPLAALVHKLIMRAQRTPFGATSRPARMMLDATSDHSEQHQDSCRALGRSGG